MSFMLDSSRILYLSLPVFSVAIVLMLACTEIVLLNRSHYCLMYPIGAHQDVLDRG